MEHQSMRAVILAEPGCLSIEQVPIPHCKPGDVLIKVEAATTCGTDLKAYLRGHPHIPMPGVFGHEYSGIVADIGEGAAFHVGDAVMGVHSAPCGTCFWCMNNQENLCEAIMETKVLGSYAEYLLVPAHIARVNLFKKPEPVSFERASLLEPLACIAHALDLARPSKSSRMLIIGPGAIGLMFVSALKYLGVDSVTLAGRNEKRLIIGEALGADILMLDQLPERLGRGFDIVVECTGREQIWERSVSCVRKGGKVVLFGGCPPGTSVQLDTSRLHYDQIEIMSPFHFGTKDVRQARGWLIGEQMNLDPILSGQRSLEQASDVFEDLKAGVGIKYVFRPGLISAE